MSDFQAGGLLKTRFTDVGLPNGETSKRGHAGYTLAVNCQAKELAEAEEGAKPELVPVTKFKRNKWYELSPLTALKNKSHGVVFAISPTKELLAQGQVKCVSFSDKISDVSIWFRPDSNIDAADIPFHIQFMAIEGVE